MSARLQRKSCLFCFLVVEAWASYSVSLCLGFLTNQYLLWVSVRKCYVEHFAQCPVWDQTPATRTHSTLLTWYKWVHIACVSVRDNKLFVNVERSSSESLWGKQEAFSNSSPGSSGGESWSHSVGYGRVFTQRQHTFASVLWGGDCCWVDTSASQLFGVKWSLPTDLLSC